MSNTPSSWNGSAVVHSLSRKPAELLTERAKTHGDFRDNAAVAQSLKDAMRAANWNELTDVQREALDFIASKIGRILAGDAEFEDHWLDISGYALLPIRR